METLREIADLIPASVVDLAQLIGGAILIYLLWSFIRSLAKSLMKSSAQKLYNINSKYASKIGVDLKLDTWVPTLVSIAITYYMWVAILTHLGVDMTPFKDLAASVLTMIPEALKYALALGGGLLIYTTFKPQAVKFDIEDFLNGRK